MLLHNATLGAELWFLSLFSIRRCRSDFFHFVVLVTVTIKDAEVNQNPDSHQTQHQLPVDLSRFIQTRRDVQHFVPAQEEGRTPLSVMKTILTPTQLDPEVELTPRTR
ncbi:hypothetical protein XENORESO_020689 [Xenotaenia resolanae]|uniref:Uncharacterized protein n=1 Tax=Xenotaenia resolanae TaxID=208358 RepID=A0ABV0WK28_9TELE